MPISLPFPSHSNPPSPCNVFFSPCLSPLLSFLSLFLSQPLPFPSLPANQFTPFPPLFPNSFPSNILSPSNHLTACPNNYTHTGKRPSCSPSCPITLPLLSVLLCIILPLSKVWRHCKLCNIVYTQFRENPAQQHTLTHTQQKRMHPAYNQRKKSHGPPVCWRLHNRPEEWCSDAIRPGCQMLYHIYIPTMRYTDVYGYADTLSLTWVPSLVCWKRPIQTLCHSQHHFQTDTRPERLSLALSALKKKKKRNLSEIINWNINMNICFLSILYYYYYYYF